MRRLWKALFYSLDGLKAAWRDEAAFRQDVALVLVSVPFALWLAPDRISLALMLASGVLVLVVELLNTGIEAAIDRHGEERHPQSKKAKDCGSAAVLVALTLMVVVWGCVLI
jgi:diacylglycerol kinase (ATP)